MLQNNWVNCIIIIYIIYILELNVEIIIIIIIFTFSHILSIEESLKNLN